MLRVELAVATPAFLDMTFVGLEALPSPGEERFAGELVRSPGGGAITAVAAARLGLDTALVAPVGDDLGGEYVRREIERDGVAAAGFRTKRTPETVIMPVGEERTMVTVDPGIRARASDVAALTPVAIAANLDQLDLVPNGVRAYLTCGDDDARAFSGKLPPKNVGARALFLNAQDACVLTATDTAAGRGGGARRVDRDRRRDRRRAQRGGDRRRRGRRGPGLLRPARWSTPPATATCCARPSPGPTCAARSRTSGSRGRSSTRSSRWACRPRSAAP